MYSTRKSWYPITNRRWGTGSRSIEKSLFPPFVRGHPYVHIRRNLVSKNPDPKFGTTNGRRQQTTKIHRMYAARQVGTVTSILSVMDIPTCIQVLFDVVDFFFFWLYKIHHHIYTNIYHSIYSLTHISPIPYYIDVSCLIISILYIVLIIIIFVVIVKLHNSYR